MTYQQPKWLPNQLSMLETLKINDFYHIQSKKFQEKLKKRLYSDTIGGPSFFAHPVNVVYEGPLMMIQNKLFLIRDHENILTLGFWSIYDSLGSN